MKPRKPSLRLESLERRVLLEVTSLLVPWQDVASPVTVPLTIDLTWDPRAL